ncbi:unnamed protein product [Cylicocyclus nassatus]|uniref:Uncharacterized protein n=1 Tax=Cylicocyclus nassatus TaxID=53992 RepID=A0AA36GFL9_CYLNA|nr:unnamed protein product [Cylicocyclus nassatus]
MCCRFKVVVLRDDLSKVQVLQFLILIYYVKETAAVYGIIILIFKPKAVTSTETEHVDLFKHRWVETHCLTVEKPVDTVLWSMNGKENFVASSAKLVSSGMRLTWMGGLDTNPSASHTAENVGNSFSSIFCNLIPIFQERAQRDHSWDVVWSTQLPHAPKYTRYSPDGAFLAVMGEYDHTVKIFYEEIEDYLKDVRGDDEFEDEHFEYRSEVHLQFVVNCFAVNLE